MSPPTPALVAVVLAMLACEPVDAPRQSFASQSACPAGETTVVPRPDYRIPLPPSETQPPPEVAADPARLADWHRRDEAAKRLNTQTSCGAALPTFDAFEVTGCGQDVILCCAHSPTPGGRPVSSGDEPCVQQPLAGGSPPLRGGGSPPVPPPSAPPSGVPLVPAPAAAPPAPVDTESHAL
jgi:hypothetical protein